MANYCKDVRKRKEGAMTPQPITRRSFVKMSAAALAAGAFGIYSFPKGREVVQAAGPDTMRITRSYASQRIAALSDLREGAPIDFTYPLDNHKNFVVKLGKDAWNGIGPDHDVVAFNYICTHMGGPMQGTYSPEYGMLGPCPFHFSRFDLSKNGTMVLGQATQSLPQIVLYLQGDDIYAEGVTGLVYGAYENPAPVSNVSHSPRSNGGARK